MEDEVTQILEAIERGDGEAADELLPLVYSELRRLAAVKLSHEPAGQTLEPTALVHEAWLKLNASRDQQWEGRRHYFGAAAEAMRRILIDRARRRQRERHGGDLVRVDLESVDLAGGTDDGTLLRLNEALDGLAEESPDKAELVKLRYFAGLTLDEIAKLRGISLATVKRHWAFARAWLLCALEDG